MTVRHKIWSHQNPSGQCLRPSCRQQQTKIREERVRRQPSPLLGQLPKGWNLAGYGNRCRCQYINGSSQQTTTVLSPIETKSWAHLARHIKTRQGQLSTRPWPLMTIYYLKEHNITWYNPRNKNACSSIALSSNRKTSNELKTQAY